MREIENTRSGDAPPATRVQVHGALVRVLSTGILLIGESGIGKSECSLDLVSKGYQLVADDVVDISVTPKGLSGQAPPLTYELLEIRGLGIINVRELFGEAAVISESAIDLCVKLQRWSEVDRLDNVMGDIEIGGRTLPKFVLPVSPGRNLATLVETAARLFLKRDTAAEAVRKLLEDHSALLRPVR